jgi:hypothetical protein
MNTKIIIDMTLIIWGLTGLFVLLQSGDFMFTSIRKSWKLMAVLILCGPFGWAIVLFIFGAFVFEYLTRLISKIKNWLEN